ncbi:TRAP transporter small permease [Salinarimonas rosea]|uniref:TRAP transporter small permease n=1 Tax=Salinarimonas rosea TaxID=552063 RepID=UPI0003FA0D82|nr:TRAP transporter small permease [Salinarimonas rosea]
MSTDDDPLVDARDTTRTEPPESRAPHARVPVRIEEALGALAMALIVAISFGNVVVRYLTNVSFAFTEEFSVFLLVFMTFVGASAAFATNEHIRITFFLDLMRPRARLLAEAVTLFATTAMFALVVYYGAQVTYDEWYWEETSPGLGYPAWIYTIWLPLLSLAILGRVVGRAIAVFRGRVR